MKFVLDLCERLFPIISVDKKNYNYRIFCITYVLFPYFVWSMFPQQYKINKIITFLNRFLFTTSVFVAMVRSHSLDIAAGSAVGWPGVLRIRVSSISSTVERFAWNPNDQKSCRSICTGTNMNSRNAQRFPRSSYQSTVQTSCNGCLFRQHTSSCQACDGRRRLLLPRCVREFATCCLKTLKAPTHPYVSFDTKQLFASCQAIRNYCQIEILKLKSCCSEIRLK